MAEAWDYIIVGAGSAGCVLANRLSADARRRVLVLEEGPDHANWLIGMPKGFGRLLRDPRYTAMHPTSGQAGGKSEVWLRGRVLGGSSSVNGMVWTRGQPQDFDDWVAAGASGWGWSEMEPYFRRLERSELEGASADGAVPVSRHPFRSVLADAVIEAGARLGWAVKQGRNDAASPGIGYLQHNIDSRRRRASAASVFVDPVRHRPNLAIATHTRVTRVVVEQGRAVAVEAVNSAGPARYECRGEIILCAGGLVSPKLLQLSGIGRGEVLRNAGIAVVSDSPNVGRNLQEHHLLALQFRLKAPQHSANRSLNGWRMLAQLARYQLFRTGPFASGSHEVAAFIASDGGDRPDLQLMFTPTSLDRTGALRLETLPGFQIFGYPLRPASRGRLEVRSPDPSAAAMIDANYLAHPEDRRLAIASVRTIRALAANAPLAHLIKEETAETAGAMTDDEILGIVRNFGQAGYHACATCAMGGAGAVTDPQLRVRGVDRLRVVDTSVMPLMISGNPNAPIMAVAWRAADLILEAAR